MLVYGCHSRKMLKNGSVPEVRQDLQCDQRNPDLSRGALMSETRNKTASLIPKSARKRGMNDE
jgi:hypothetical protein